MEVLNSTNSSGQWCCKAARKAGKTRVQAAGGAEPLNQENIKKERGGKPSS